MSEISKAVTSNAQPAVTYRRPLNTQQLTTLHYLYWYRFCTSKQLAVVLQKSNHKAIQAKLQILEAQGFIGKRYDKSYKLAGRPAEYFVTPKGARALEAAKPNATNPKTTKSLYKNKTVSDDFLRHCIAIRETAQRLIALYGEQEAKKLQSFTKAFMVQYDTYPTWTPDLYLEYRVTKSTIQHYFVDIWDGAKPFFVTVRKTQNYVKFKDEGDWYDDTPFPAVLAVCEDTRTQTKLNRQMKRILDEAWDDELVFATTTKLLLNRATKPTERIWSKVDADEEPVSVSLRSLVVTEDS